MHPARLTPITLTTPQQLAAHLQQFSSLKGVALRRLDLTQHNLASVEVQGATLLACLLTAEQETDLRARGAILFPSIDAAKSGLPYQPFRTSLYTWQELLEGWAPEEHDPARALRSSADFAIYRHCSDQRYNPPITEALYQRIHDFAIDEALRELVDYDHDGMTNQRIVGFMGGHGKLRTSAEYITSVHTAKLLTEAGYFIASGGGPGIMEAANLGAYLAGRSEQNVSTALRILAEAPHYTSPRYIQAALEVLKAFPEGKGSLAIPTWFYGHEPSNVFASHIAKYFSNSIREDTLLAVSLHGIVFAPGSAGTTQEIFMDAAQNHYGTFGYYSPMVFLGSHRYAIQTLIYPLLKQLSYETPYHTLLHLTDEPADVLAFIKAHPPVKKAEK